MSLMQYVNIKIYPNVKANLKNQTWKMEGKLRLFPFNQILPLLYSLQVQITVY